MSTLVEHLEELRRLMEKSGNAPTAIETRIVEVGPNPRLDSRGRIQLEHGAIVDPSAYEARFQELLARGVPWLNVSCYGVLDGRLVVAIEVPGSSPQRSSRTSINYSGPSAVVIRHDWDATEVLAVE
jgi:hypothetical protein